MEERKINMSVSSICEKNGEKYAFVFFTDNDRTAEGKIPDCKLILNKGFTEDEARQLEEYMKKELSKLKKMAAEIRLFDAFKQK